MANSDKLQEEAFLRALEKKDRREPTLFQLPPDARIHRSPHERFLSAPIADQDAAKRMSDTHALHMSVDPMGHLNHYIAFKLEDGTSDGNLYPTWADARRHQKGDPDRYVYMCTVPSGFPPHDALQLLYYGRASYKNGWVTHDPDKIRSMGRPERAKRYFT